MGRHRVISRCRYVWDQAGTATYLHWLQAAQLMPIPEGDTGHSPNVSENELRYCVALATAASASAFLSSGTNAWSAATRAEAVRASSPARCACWWKK